MELKQKIDENALPGVFSWSALSFSPDGKRLAVAGFQRLAVPGLAVEGAFVKVWDNDHQKIIEGKAVRGKIPRELDRVSCLAFSPDGKVVAAAWDDAKIRLFDGQTGDFRTLLDTERKLGSYRMGVGGIAFSPGSKTLASTGGDSSVVLWDVTGSLTIPP